MADGKVLVVGALGVVGRSVIELFEAERGWDIVGIARRQPDFQSSAQFISVDLRDQAACMERLSQLRDITHIVYCANYEKPNLVSGWIEPDHVEINRDMLRNLLGAVVPQAASLRHITVLQGTKAYGAAAGPFKIPGKENDPRYIAPNFYYAQEDDIRALQKGKSWSWTVLRPQFVCGYATGSSLNGIAPVGVYAAVSRELGMPLRFPGGAPRVQEATDARLLAKAILWAGSAPQCANEIFNIVNGDCYTWESLWPKIAKHFGMEVAPPSAVSLTRVMVDKGPVWDSIVAKHGLKKLSIKDLVPNWQFADSLFGYGSRPNPSHVSGIKARKYGFHECQDSEDMFLEWLQICQDQKILPV